jgi:hypothetical protein
VFGFAGHSGEFSWPIGGGKFRAAKSPLSKHFEQDNRYGHDQQYRHKGNGIAGPRFLLCAGVVSGSIFEFFGGFKVFLPKLGESIGVVVIHARIIQRSKKSRW